MQSSILILVEAKRNLRKRRQLWKMQQKKTDGLELLDVLVPASDWNYAALIKSKNFEIFTQYIKKTREEPTTFFAKRGLHPPPKKLELLVDIGHLE